MIHKIVVVVEVESNSYEIAKCIASEWLYDIGNYNNMIGKKYVENNFEHDEVGQRVLYLPPENQSHIVNTNGYCGKCIEKIGNLAAFLAGHEGPEFKSEICPGECHCFEQDVFCIVHPNGPPDDVECACDHSDSFCPIHNNE